MRSSVGQCRNIRFRQLSASHVIISSVYRGRKTTKQQQLEKVSIGHGCLRQMPFRERVYM